MNSSDQQPSIGPGRAPGPRHVPAAEALCLCPGHTLLHRGSMFWMLLTALLPFGSPRQLSASDSASFGKESAAQPTPATGAINAPLSPAAEHPRARQSLHQIWLGLDGFYIDSYLRGSASRSALSLAWNYTPMAQHPLQPSLYVGARLASPPTYSGNSLEAYFRPTLSPHLGVWRPSMGIELGLTPFMLFDPKPRGVSDSAYQQESDQQTPFYVALHAAPARFQWKRLSLSVLEVQWGTPVLSATKIARMHVGLLQIGWTL